MGRRNGPAATLGSLFGAAAAALSVSAQSALRAVNRAGSLGRSRSLGVALLLSTAIVATGLSAVFAPVLAQTLNDRIAPKKTDQPDRLLVQAKELIYDSKTNKVGASGNVQLYYQGRVLEADRVTLDRNTNRVHAEGHARMTETNGTVSYADRMELTNDFKTGFIDSLKMDTAENTHMSAPRVERLYGQTTVFENGTYTACDACKEDPTKPPLWQVRAKRIIHQNDEQTIYYEEATLELFGMPVAYLPFFSAPDPTVKRRTGWLMPHYVMKDQLGFGIAAPYFWAISPSMDITATPTVLSRQGLLADVEFRHRVTNGSYSFRVAGIQQASPDAFIAAPYGAGNRNFRGSVDTSGEFYINEKWRFGWDLGFATDKYFWEDYKQSNQTLSSNYFRERTSQVYLTGQAGRGYFDLRGYYFQGLSAYDRQEQQPFVAPVLDYNKTFDIRPERSAGIGGQIELDFNLTSIQRQQAVYESTTGLKFDPTYNLYQICNQHPTGYKPSDCLLRGIAGEYTRMTANLTWKRQFIDPIGQVWTPFAFANLNGSWLSLDKTGSYFAGGIAIGNNADQANFLGGNPDTFRGRGMAGAGVEYRLPLIARTQGITHVVEPIAQIIVRPSEVTSQALVNEDAQSLVFDDSNLFSISKYSGYDRFEGGVRANYGAQYTAKFDGGGYASLMAGQSYQLAGRNSYASPDAANIGLSSGLDTKQSDFVTRAAFAPNTNYTFVAKGRFDPDDYSLRRVDFLANARWGALGAGLQYARYEAQPLLGYDKRREGLAANSVYNFDNNIFVNGSVIFDMSRHLYTASPSDSKPLFSVAGLGLGAGYRDECATLTVNYTSTFPQSVNGTPTTRNQTVVFQLQLRTLGEAKVASSVAGLFGGDVAH
ncbi:MAG: LPS-assembly protein LptD [Hyphomicrobiales bacterium]|nr:LPS-assembly protein LptD [Hyphomicrobiales bacterium]